MNPARTIPHSILGTALGDSLGLPSEGMSRRRIARRWKGPLRQRFFLGHGMLSDDTEHTVFVAQALIECGGDAAVFEKLLAKKLRWWFAGLPAGIGLATAKAIIKLWIGFRPGKNGIYSAGNGPVMRAPVIGACFATDAVRRAEFVRNSTLLTHTDPKALEAAMMAADCAAFATTGEMRREVILAQMDGLAAAPEWREPLGKVRQALEDGIAVEEFATRMGFERGVSGYAVHTMAAVLFIWLRHRGNFPAIVRETIACGGDTDSVAAIAGGIAGAEADGFEPGWLERIGDRPFTPTYLRELGDALARSSRGDAANPPRYPSLWIPPRNLFFLAVVLAHGLRRLLPPY